MNDRVSSSPLVVLGSGFGAVLFVALALGSGSSSAWGHVLWLVGGGALGAMGGAAGAVGVWLGNRRAVGDIDQALHSARHDTLTGLVNRAELYRELEASLADGARDKTIVGVLFLDLNKFKIVNDTLGHDAGDELLKVVASRLRGTIRSTDVVARLGGDEFVVVCRDLLVADSVLNVASQVLRRFKEPVALAGGVMHEVGGSIGIAIALPGDERTPEDLLRDADAAMYRAKRERTGYHVFDDATRSQQLDRAAVEAELARAVEQEQFIVFYQPIVDVIDQKLLGFEALLRWRHPERGLIEPRDFIGIADQVGLMSRIGSIALREACAQMAIWNHLSPAARKLRVSVNLAEQQLTDPNLTSQFEELLAWAGLKPRQLMVEVSESLLGRHPEDLDSLRALRDLGVTVAVDGFGTAGSLFSHARSFDMVSILKIDRSFVREVLHDDLARATVEAMVAMAGPLGLQVVVEGVEDAEQLALLRAMGVRLMQGYLFNAPDYAEVVDPGRWFEDWSSRQDAGHGLLPTPTR